jgi:hypothetical protein
MAAFEMQDFISKINLGTLATGTLAGGITSIRVSEEDPPGSHKDNQIIRHDRNWSIILDFELVGTVLDSPFFTIPGNWIVNGYLEGWGVDAKDMDLKSAHGDTGFPVTGPQRAVDPARTGGPPETKWGYVEFINVSAGSVEPGTYKLAVTLTYKDENGNPGPMAGFVEFPGMIQIYEPGK